MILEYFAEENRNKFTVDLGCGPGQTTKFLKENGVNRIPGVDLSAEMVKIAIAKNRGIEFETGDMLKLKYENEKFGSAVAFYSIVHFTYHQAGRAFKEIHRILKEKGQFLFSFHIGKHKIHLETFLNEKADIQFYFFETEKILKLLSKADLELSWQQKDSLIRKRSTRAKELIYLPKSPVRLKIPDYLNMIRFLFLLKLI